MEKCIISASFVGVFERPIVKIPNFDTNFCKNLFDTPSETISFYGPDGFVVSVKDKIQPIFNVNPLKIVIKVSNKEQLMKIIRLCNNEFEKHDINSNFCAFGINWEYQYFELGQDCNKWLWDHFIKSNIDIKCNYKFCSKLNFSFVVSEEQTLNISLEPRIGVRDGLFASTNNHYNKQLDLFTNDKMISDYIDSSEILTNESLESLLGANCHG